MSTMNLAWRAWCDLSYSCVPSKRPLLSSIPGWGDDDIDDDDDYYYLYLMSALFLKFEVLYNIEYFCYNILQKEKQ